MLVHRRRVASLALTATMFALAMGCTPVSLPTFDDGKNSSVGGFNGSNGTGGTNGGSTATPTPTPTATPTPVNYGTLTWVRSDQNLDVPRDNVAGAVLDGNFVVVGGITAGGGIVNTVSTYPVAGATLGAPTGTPQGYRANITGGSDAVCSHGAYIFGNHLIVAGGLTQLLGRTANTVSALRENLFTGIWADSNAMPESVEGGRQDFGMAQTDTFAYVVGGFKGSTGGNDPGEPSSDILVATHFNGTLTGWQVAGSLPGATIVPASVVANGRLYVYGGQQGIGAGQALVNTVSSYAINEDGTLGARQAETSELETTGSLPIVSGAMLTAFGNNLYAIGGMGSNGPRKETYISVIGADGKLSKWRPAGLLPDPVALAAVGTDTAGHFYLAGGRTEFPTSQQGGEPNSRIYVGTATLQ